MKLVEKWDGRSEDINKAAELFSTALSLDNQCVEAITGKGRIALRNGYISGQRYRKDALNTALSYAEKALSINKDYFRAYKLKGRVLSLMGRHKEAENLLPIIEKLDPECERYDYKIRLNEMQSRIDNAIALIPEYIACLEQKASKDKLGNTYADLARLYHKKGDYDSTTAYYEKAFKYNPKLLNHAWTLGNYSDTLIDKGDLKKAEEMAKKALSIMDYPMAHSYLSRIYAKRGEQYLLNGNMEKAEIEFLLAKAEDPYYKFPYFELAHIYAQKGMCNKSTELAKEVLSFDPDDATAKEIIAYCKEKH